MIHERLACRLCDAETRKVFELRPTAIANSFPDKPDSKAERFPIELMQCVDCSHVQLRHVVSGLFNRDYKYQTPETVKTYLEPVAKELRRKYPKAKHALEIGCNNGIFLDLLAKEGFGIVGVDPATSHMVGIKAPFTEELSKKFNLTFDLVVANNVFAHIDDLQDVFRGINNVLSENGALVFEVQYLPDLINNGAFDMIYHEHLDYHTLGPLRRFVKKMGFVMTEYEHIRTHGGSMRVTVLRQGDETQIPRETLNWESLTNLITQAKERVYKRINGKVASFGAAAKACTLIEQLELKERISYCVDDTPQKQYRYIPGTDIQVLPVSELKDDTVLVTAWNYFKEVEQRLPGKALIHPFQ